jgi:hypothetical protein
MFNQRNLHTKMESVFAAHAQQFVDRLSQQKPDEPFDLQGISSLQPQSTIHPLHPRVE